MAEGVGVRRRGLPPGPGRVLVLAYGFFTLAAGARSIVQLAVDPSRAPVAYGLSLVAAVVYGVNTVLVARSVGHDTVAVPVLFGVELGGVMLVGLLSVVAPDWFPDASVWSDFGVGYGFVPLLLPVLGLVWWRRRHRYDGPNPLATR